MKPLTVKISDPELHWNHIAHLIMAAQRRCIAGRIKDELGMAKRVWRAVELVRLTKDWGWGFPQMVLWDWAAGPCVGDLTTVVSINLDQIEVDRLRIKKGWRNGELQLTMLPEPTVTTSPRCRVVSV